MLASVTRWHIAESVRDAAAFVDYIQPVLRKHLTILRKHGLLDILMIRTAEDMLIAVALYEDDAEGQEAWVASQIAFRDDLLGKLDLVSRVTGPAFELPQLLDDGDGVGQT